MGRAIWKGTVCSWATQSPAPTRVTYTSPKGQTQSRFLKPLISEQHGDDVAGPDIVVRAFMRGDAAVVCSCFPASLSRAVDQARGAVSCRGTIRLPLARAGARDERRAGAADSP